MLCKNPFVRDPSGRCFKSSNKEDWLKGIPFPCGQCLPCRINRRRVWATRLWLEAISHADNLPMILLTYDDDHIPKTEDGQYTLCKRDIQLYVKRLRKMGLRFRYYIAGEYGEDNERPHYHALFFGLSQIFAEQVCTSWLNGFSSLGYDSSYNAIQYVAGYVTKKMIHKVEGEKRVPEFALMSRKPALGSLALSAIVDAIKANPDPDFIQNVLSYPTLRINGRFSPLGRTLSDKLRAILGSEHSTDAYAFEMRKLWFSANRMYDPWADDFTKGALAQALMNESKQRNVQIEKRCKIFNLRNKC